MTTETEVLLSSLHAGDPVVLDSSRYGQEILSLERVHRVTATQIIVCKKRFDSSQYEQRFDRDSGRLKGEQGYQYTKLRTPTPELLQRIEKATLAGRFANVKWNTLHLDTLRAVDAAMARTAANAQGRDK